MTEEKKSYQQIFKATSIFGGVQIFLIIITIIRYKFVAVLLGPAGLGIISLLTSTSGFISALTNFGLGTSAVKNVAAASAAEENVRITTVVSVLRRLVWFTGVFGMIVTVIFSPILSRLAFGNEDYTLAFIWISVTLLFQQLTKGQLVLLQGLRKLQYLAKANIFGAAIGLIISIPLFYLWRIDAIVPVILLSSLISVALSWYYSRKLSIKSISLSKGTILKEGGEMMRMGFFISVSGLISYGVSYILRIYISNSGGMDQVGLYAAGFAIIGTYVGMVFTAMGTDFYPRLSAVAQDNQKSNLLINQQAKVAILILAPILNVFLVFVNLVIIIFYSNKFIAVNEMIYWATLGMYFKASSWSIAFILLAKGASKLFFWNELMGNIYILGLNIVGYNLAGLEGLGISFVVAYFLYFIQVYLIASLKYGFRFDREFYKVAGFQLLLGLLCFGFIITLDAPWKYIAGIPIILVSSIFSFLELDRRIGLRTIIKSQLEKLRKRG